MLKQIIFMGFVFCSFGVVLSFLIVLLQLLQVIFDYCRKKTLGGRLYIGNWGGNLVQTPELNFCDKFYLTIFV